VSSGGIIFRKDNGEIEVALISRKHGNVWCLPKGTIEKGETLEQTAIREVREETGLEGEILEKIGDINYWYMSEKKKNYKKYFKNVHFYLMKYKNGDTANHDDEVDDAKWFEINKAYEIMTYKSEKEIMKKAMEILENVKNKK
jgi:8-oxo-dGTP pyrophosphatase MutT (NUDIX family)